jgi:predicted aconitase with swiveling domain
MERPVMTIVTARVLFAGEAEADILRLDEPLSFWGGFDPLTGVILDNNHPQKGQHLTGRALVMPATRGSGGTPGGVAEAIRNGSAPAAIIMREGDINVMVGAAVAQELYGLTCPILEVSGADYDTVASAPRLRIHEGGTIELVA